MSHLLLAALAATTALSGAAPAERFVGVWELDLAQSRLAANHPAADYGVTRVISWDGASITESDTVRNLDFAGFKFPSVKSGFTLATDDQEHPAAGLNRLPILPSKTMANASWQGDNLVVQGRGADPLGHWVLSRRFFLSPDGNRLTEIVTDDGSPLGVTDARLVFDRVK